MCYMIDWPGVGWIQTQGELAPLVPELKNVDGSRYEPFEPETCLCPVGIKQTLDAADVEWERQPGIPEYRVHPNKTPERAT